MNFQIEIERLIEAYNLNQQFIVQLRVHKLKALREYFRRHGYPPKCRLYHLSLIPAYYQEAIYDGINWYEQAKPLLQLEIELELDCMFQNEGKTREELSPDEFEEYDDFCSKAISGTWRLQSTWLSRFLEKIGFAF